MKKLLYVVLVLAGLVIAAACSRTESEKARQVAVDSYRHLVEGHPQGWVDALAYRDSMTEEYRQQLVDLMAQYIERERVAHGGLKDVSALSDTVMDSVAYVFLELVYADSLREEVLVPLLRCGDEWKLQ